MIQEMNIIIIARKLSKKKDIELAENTKKWTDFKKKLCDKKSYFPKFNNIPFFDKLNLLIVPIIKILEPCPLKLKATNIP